MATKTTVNPFSSAAKKPASSLKKSTRPIYIASDVHDLNTGGLLYHKAEVEQGIHNYIEGHTQFELGKAMKDTNRPIVLNFTRQNFAKEWLMNGSRPENPAIQNKEDGSGDQLKVIFQDSTAKLDDAQFDQLSSIIGQTNADAETIRRNEFTVNPELLDEKVKVTTKNGKIEEQTVMDAMVEALQEKFGPSPEILANLFKAKEVFETKKGLIDRGLKYVASGKTDQDAARLANFLEVGRFTTQIKVGAKE